MQCDPAGSANHSHIPEFQERPSVYVPSLENDSLFLPRMKMERGIVMLVRLVVLAVQATKVSRFAEKAWTQKAQDSYFTMR
jgi:hypothetical protein